MRTVSLNKIIFFNIAAVDLDRIARELDVYTLQENIDHLTFCNIDTEIVSQIHFNFIT